MTDNLTQLRNVLEHDETSELNELFGALAKAQLEMEVANTDSTNPFFKSKYADLSTVVKASRPYLAKNGLSIIQRVITLPDGKNALKTRLCHSSGQWIESTMHMNPPKQDIQTIGSFITYLRRYMYSSMTGVVAANEDDDGEKVMSNERKASAPVVSAISKDQLSILANELDGYPEILKEILKGYKIDKLSDMPAKHYTMCLTRVKEVKMAKES